MKISIDGQEIFSLSEIQKKVIQNDIPTDIFESDMHRRVAWCAEHPCDQCYDSHKKGWMDKLKEAGVKSAPVDKLSLCDSIHKVSPISIPSECEKDTVVHADGKEIFRVTPTHKRMIQLVHQRNPDEYCIAQMGWILKHKYERCMERLRNEWTERLASKGVVSIPTDDDEFATLVFAQPDYKNRSQRESK